MTMPVITWREWEGVEPTVDTEGCPPTELKSAKPTGAHPPPRLASLLVNDLFYKAASSLFFIADFG